MTTENQQATLGTTRSIVTTRHLYWVVLVGLSLVLGVLALFVDPLYIMVGLAAIVVAIIMVKYQFFGLVVYLAVFTLRLGESYPALAALRLELLIGGSLTILTILSGKYKYGSVFIPKSRLNLDFLMIIGCMGMSLWLSSCKDCTVDMIVEMAKLGIFFLLIVLNVDSRSRLETFLWLFLALNAKLAFDIMWGFYHGAGIVKDTITRASGGNSTMDNYNGIAITMNTLIPFAYYLFVHYRSFAKKTLMGLMLAIFVWTMVLTGSRGGFLGFCAILGLIWWQSKHKGLVGIGLMMFGVAAWTVLGDATKDRYMSIFGDSLDESSQGRVDSWIDGLQLFLTRPLFGVGAGAFAWARVDHFGTYLNAHSLYIQVVAELGLAGVVAYYCFIRDIIKINLDTARKVENSNSKDQFLAPFARATIITCSSMLVTGIFAHSAYRYTWYFMAAMTLVASEIARKNSLNLGEGGTEGSVIEEADGSMRVEANK